MLLGDLGGMTVFPIMASSPGRRMPFSAATLSSMRTARPTCGRCSRTSWCCATRSATPRWNAAGSASSPLVLQPGRDARHHAEVDERDLAVYQENVARMRIGVEQPVAQHLPQVGAEQRVGQTLAVELEARERAQRGDLASADELHGEHARGAVGEHRLGHADLLDLPEI